MIAAAPLLTLSPPWADPPRDGEDIVVTAGRTRPPGAIDHLRRFCFDPLRRDRAFLRPDGGADRDPAAAADRDALAQGEPGQAFAHLAEGRGRVVLWQGRVAHADGRSEWRCRMAVGGGDPEAGLVGALAGLFGGPPTQRHVGARGGVPPVPGWRQWLWTAAPQRGSARWVSSNAGRRGPPSWTAVVDPALYYRQMDYVTAELQTRAGGEPFAIVTLRFHSKDAR